MHRKSLKKFGALDMKMISPDCQFHWATKVPGDTAAQNVNKLPTDRPTKGPTKWGNDSRTRIRTTCIGMRFLAISCVFIDKEIAVAETL